MACLVEEHLEKLNHDLLLFESYVSKPRNRNIFYCLENETDVVLAPEHLPILQKCGHDTNSIECWRLTVISNNHQFIKSYFESNPKCKTEDYVLEANSVIDICHGSSNSLKDFLNTLGLVINDLIYFLDCVVVCGALGNDDLEGKLYDVQQFWRNYAAEKMFEKYR